MGTLFLIGNGFDLNCGMHTSYAEAYKEYIKIESESEVIKQFKKDISGDIANWGDFEIAMGAYAQRFKSAKDFIACINDFQAFLCDYLTKQENKILEEIELYELREAIATEMHDSLSTFYQGISNNVNSLMEKRKASLITQMNFISFNYTDVFDRLLVETYEFTTTHLNPVCHIHGGLEDSILGVDNEEQIIASFPITDKVRRYFVKPFFNEEYDTGRVREAEFEIESADTICVFGMSLGLSDIRWRRMLFEWLRESNNRHLLLYVYEMSKKRYKTIQERLDIEEDAKIARLEEWKVSNYEEIFDRFHIICGRNIFNIESIIKKKKAEIISKRK